MRSKKNACRLNHRFQESCFINIFIQIILKKYKTKQKGSIQKLAESKGVKRTIVIKSREKLQPSCESSIDDIDEDEDRETRIRRSSIKGGHEIYVQPHRRSSVPDIMVTTTVMPTPIKSILKKAPASSKEQEHKEKDFSSFTQGSEVKVAINLKILSFGKTGNG